MTRTSQNGPSLLGIPVLSHFARRAYPMRHVLLNISETAISGKTVSFLAKRVFSGISGDPSESTSAVEPGETCVAVSFARERALRPFSNKTTKFS